jgi:tetratricopeptide (TPR) repeat protein
MQNSLRNGLIGGVIVVGLMAVGAGGYLWQQRASEQARAEQLAAEKQQLEEKVRLAEDAAKAREVALQAQAEQERMRVNAELALAKASPATSEPQVASNAAPTDAVEHAKMLLSDAVPKAEADRRRALNATLEKEDRAAIPRLSAMQAQKIFSTAGIGPADASAAATRLEQAVLSPSSGTGIETTLLAIDGMPKLARGDRKPARSANDEGLRMMQAGRFEDATVAFNRAFSHDPADMEVLGNLSYAYLKNGQLVETQRISNYAVRVSPRRAGAWNQLAMAHAQRGADWLAVRAFVVLYTLSNDHAKTRDFLNRTAAENTDERVRDAAKYALLVLPESLTH